VAGTDRRKLIEAAGPVIVLVEPQLAENIGTAARAMLNFGLTEMRLVRPRPKPKSEKAQAAASGAETVLEAAAVFHTVEAAIADLSLVYATTARERGQAKPVDAPAAAAVLLRERIAAGERVGILFGRERTGLENDEVALADRVLTFPVNPGFASLNLAQAVLLVGYEWWRATRGEAPPFEMPARSPAATKAQLLALFAHLEGELDAADFFRNAEKRAVMTRNLRNIFHRLAASRQDLQTLHGVFAALVEGRRTKARRERKVLAPLREVEEE
jgi:tRNA/rRNA methyltransferase